MFKTDVSSFIAAAHLITAKQTCESTTAEQIRGREGGDSTSSTANAN